MNKELPARGKNCLELRNKPARLIVQVTLAEVLRAGHIIMRLHRLSRARFFC